MTARWPEALWIVRHGQSAGNVARDAANAANQNRIVLSGRDVDVPLSQLGERQADALGAWFAGADLKDKPEIVLSSPYVRAIQTADRFIAAGGSVRDSIRCVDERLREKEFGILDGLTTPGIEAEFPDQARLRRTLGKFYHRAPGGESWTDVIMRLRLLMDTVLLHHAGRRVMIVAHQVVVLCLRYVIENLDEAQILAIDRQGDVANCSVTEYRFAAEHSPPRLALVRYNATRPVSDADEIITDAPDQIVAVRG
ncbi:MAG: Broad specificity phosphatase PhoE [Sphingomonadales bacterium]|nr:Broad specificity phosphatase PhoE [Sphingomonadales bacterium]